MFKLTQLIDFDPKSDRAAALDALRAAGSAAGAARATAIATLPGVHNGGDLIWHVQFETEKAWRAWTRDQKARLANLPGVTQVQSVAYQGGASGAQKPGMKNSLYRIALFCANQNVTPERVKAFEGALSRMPRYIKAIRNWQLSRVLEVQAIRPFTHVWEQEYDRLEDLQGPYLFHPHHWAWVDTWFNPECPNWLVDGHLTHTFATLPDSVIAPR
jgi:hypothetical protein